jgi:hypothetical protein
MVVNCWGCIARTVPICPGRLGVFIVDRKAFCPRYSVAIVVNCGVKATSLLELAGVTVIVFEVGTSTITFVGRFRGELS